MWGKFGVGLWCLWAAACTAQTVGPVRVIDGDTLTVNGVKIRLHGIDAPEARQMCRTEHGVAWACGAWVTGQVADLLDGQNVVCDALTTDRYDRVVARCATGGVDIGADLVSGGLAFAYRKYSAEYVNFETDAAALDRGLHGFNVQSPAWFRQTRAKGRIPPDPACPIKGNLSDNGRIFHVPGQTFYERTGINPARGEMWFCSQEEALAAGWRKARR